MTRRRGQEGTPLWRGTFTAPPCRPAGQGQAEAAGQSSDPHSDPETRRVGPWRERSCEHWGPESLPPKPLLSYMEPQGAETSPREGFPRKGGSKAPLETPASLSPPLLPH